MKYRDRLLRAAIKLVDRNRRKAYRDRLIHGDLDFLEVVDQIMAEIDEDIEAHYTRKDQR